MTIKQVSVFAENRTGGILDVIRALGEGGVDIRALSVADTQGFGILRLIVDNIDKAKSMLSDSGTIYSITDVVGVKVPDSPGGLSSVLTLLADNQINVEYLYAFVSVPGTSAYVVLRVADNDEAIRVLTSNGIELVTEEEITAL
ncbi:MAG: ACT domain-containing protein [Oscillospiraceae bacterium]|nr:ACT domain-containing protein [Oscillospiraceae bacterium]